MMKKKSSDNQMHVFAHDVRGNSPDDKRFVGLNEAELQKISTRNDRINNEEDSVQDGPRTVWMDGDNNNVYRVPPGVERRQDAQNTRIFHQRNGGMNNMKKSGDQYWFHRQGNEKAPVAEKENPAAEQVQKKDAETVDDFQFFKDDDQKRISKRMTKVTKTTKKSEEQRKMDEKHEELMDEYMKYIAQATSIKKRSPVVPFRKEEELYEMSQAESVNERLKDIERIILDEANDIMKEPLPSNEIETEVMNRVRAANDLDNIRNSIMDLQDIMYEIRSEDTQQNDMYIQEKRGNKLANALNVMAPTDRKRGLDQDFSYNEGRRAFLTLSAHIFRDSVFINAIAASAKCYECPDEELYSRDCSLLTNFLPDGEYKKYFRSACTEHQFCYICMDVYGTTASECDSGFLEDSYRICGDNRPCRTATKTMILSNRRKQQNIGAEIGNCELKLCLKNKLDVKRSTEK
ncbi:hypothetical protein GQR58_027611 [Nymphon striatum]|nr:hypothetical protein GQR58_027611 [Nymphon striatum]